MKRYATTYSNGHTVEESNWVWASQWQNHDDEQKFFLFGKPVSAEVFFAAIQQARQKDFDKKNQNHKQVCVLYGSSVACYITKWVRR
jgi:hypothetical protein